MAVIIAAIVAPAGVRSIATIRLCFVSGRGADLDEAGAALARDAALRIFRAVERVVAFGLDLGFVTGFSEVYAAPSAAPPQPRPGKSPGRARPRSQLSRSSHHSNAPIKPESQSILSQIIAHLFLNRGYWGVAKQQDSKIAGIVFTEKGVEFRKWPTKPYVPTGIKRKK